MNKLAAKKYKKSYNLIMKSTSLLATVTVTGGSFSEGMF